MGELIGFFIRIPAEMHAQLTEIASERGQKMSELARRALQDLIDRRYGIEREDLTDPDRVATIRDVERMIAEHCSVTNSSVGGDVIQGGKKVVNKSR